MLHLLDPLGYATWAAPRALHTEKPHAWFNALLSPSWNWARGAVFLFCTETCELRSWCCFLDFKLQLVGREGKREKKKETHSSYLSVWFWNPLSWLLLFLWPKLTSRYGKNTASDPYFLSHFSEHRLLPAAWILCLSPSPWAEAIFSFFLKSEGTPRSSLK